MDAKIWSPISQNYPNLAAGQIVQLEGKANLYRDKVEIHIERLRELSEAEEARLDLSLLCQVSVHLKLCSQS